MLINRAKEIVLVLSAMSLLGCQHVSSFGENVLKRAEDAKMIGTQWQQGEKMVMDGNISKTKAEKYISKGQDMVKEGKKQMKKGHAMLDDAQDKIKQGEALKSKSESDYKEKYAEKSQ